MLKITNTEVFGWEAAIRGMRNPKESWEKSDSFICKERGAMTNEEINTECGKCPRTKSCDIFDDEPHFIVGKNDLKLMKQLVAAGTDHSKFMRMVHVQCDMEGPLYWWKEMDTYKVATVRNSCSTMHKIADKRFERCDFSIEHIENCNEEHWMVCMDNVISSLNVARERYLRTKDKKYWWQLIQLLPSSYNQKATMDLNYATLRNMYHSRKNHKLDEWRIDFCNWVKTLPYSELITMTKEELLESIKEE